MCNSSLKVVAILSDLSSIYNDSASICYSTYQFTPNILTKVLVMMNVIQSFVKSESGAVTVDFVVLTAMVVGMGLAVVSLLAPSLNPALSGVDPAMENAPTLGASLIGG